MYVLLLPVSRSSLIVSFLNCCRSSTSVVAVCISTCLSEASNVFSVVMVVDEGSATELTVFVGFSIGNLLMQRLR